MTPTETLIDFIEFLPTAFIFIMKNLIKYTAMGIAFLVVFFGVLYMLSIAQEHTIERYNELYGEVPSAYVE